MDYSEYGGSVLLGLEGTVVKAHGSSNAKAFYSAIQTSENRRRTKYCTNNERDCR